MPPRRFLLVGTFLALLIVLILTYRRASLSDNPHINSILDKIHGEGTPADPDNTPCLENLGWLDQYQFTYPLKYVARDIIARPHADGARPNYTVMEAPLFKDFATINLAESKTLKTKNCLPPLELEVPLVALAPVDASNVIFGCQTTLKRLKDTVKHLARWLPHTGARLICIVIDSESKADPKDEHTTTIVYAEDTEMRALEKEYNDKGMLVSIVHPLDPTDYFARRYVSLTKIMYEARDEKTQWISHIDDDTFFPSMHALKAELGQHDWNKPHYLGALSEDWWAVDHYGLMAFGGAGLFMSLPLATVVAENYDQCRNTVTSAGDISVMDCIYRFSHTKLTYLPSLHQVDMHGDLSGFYESGREMLSLHHWKEGSTAGHKLEIEKMHFVSDICDTCFLQRWQFPNELLLTNGFSITSYPEGHLTGVKTNLLGNIPGSVGTVEKIDLQNMEETWNDEIRVHHSLAPIRGKLPPEQKLSWKLFDSMIELDKGEKVVKQVYLREGTGDGAKDEVMVLNWRAAVKA